MNERSITIDLHPSSFGLLRKQLAGEIMESVCTIRGVTTAMLMLESWWESSLREGKCEVGVSSASDLSSSVFLRSE